jgi:hypothetical protein
MRVFVPYGRGDFLFVGAATRFQDEFRGSLASRRNCAEFLYLTTRKLEEGLVIIKNYLDV